MLANMSAHPVLGKPPKAPTSKPAVARSEGSSIISSSNNISSSSSSSIQDGSYVGRYHRLRRMNQQKNVSSDIHKMIQKSLPKISGDLDRSRAAAARGLQSTAEAKVTSLPGVQTQDSGQKQPISPRRKSLPMKTFHFRVNPEHSSFISKSLPSLPSIPGSPSYPEDQAVSPLTDRQLTDRDRARVPVFPSKHRFEKIVVRKHIHGEQPTSSITETGEKTHRLPLKPALKHTNNNNNNDNNNKPQHIGAHTARTGWGHNEPGPTRAHTTQDDNTTNKEPIKSHRGSNGSVRIRYSQMTSQRVVSATQSEPAFEVSRKWKEDCTCLRCQMLKRQFQEGDAHYQLWGRYPCHHVDPAIMLDD